MLCNDPPNEKFPKLFEPGYIGKLRIKNRIIKAPTLTCFASRDGCVTQRMINHYAQLAQGGSGLIIVEYTYVDDIASKSAQCQLGVSSDEHRPGLQWLASTIKANGSSACLQIAHAGREKFLGTPPIKAPSRIPWEEIYEVKAFPPEELTFEETRQIVEAFGEAALRAKQAGFDMVEVHGAHGYLITNFLSPRFNRRTDWYGGDLKNRMRILLEIVNSIREKTGPNFPLSVRLSGTDYEENSITIEETKNVAQVLQKLGVNIIHVSGGDHHTYDKQVAPVYGPLGNNVWCAEEISKVVTIPVIASGSITTPELAEKILAEGKADFISFGRPLLADPCFPLKARENRPEDIRPCIRCLDGCVTRGVMVGSVSCSVNSTLGREGESKIVRLNKGKRVAIVGGGPAGMEAARVAALRGHKVTLFEKRQLGGMLIEASVPEFKADLRKLIDYLSVQVKKGGVEIVFRDVAAQVIKEGEFDACIVATGATPRIPDVPGTDKPLVVGGLEVLQGAKMGKNIVVVGGGRIGRDVALFLAEQGKRVVITTRRKDIAQGMNRGEQLAYFQRLSKRDVEIRAGLHLEEITDNGIVVRDTRGEKSDIKGDNVVLATGLVPNRGLYDELAGTPGLQVYAVGDCVEPRSIFDAIHEGFYAAIGTFDDGLD